MKSKSEHWIDKVQVHALVEILSNLLDIIGDEKIYYHRPVIQPFSVVTTYTELSAVANKVVRRLCADTHEKSIELLKIIYTHKRKLNIDIQQTNSQGESALSYAESRNSEIYNYLQKSIRSEKKWSAFSSDAPTQSALTQHIADRRYSRSTDPSLISFSLTFKGAIKVSGDTKYNAIFINIDDHEYIASLPNDDADDDSELTIRDRNQNKFSSLKLTAEELQTMRVQISSITPFYVSNVTMTANGRIEQELQYRRSMRDLSIDNNDSADTGQQYCLHVHNDEGHIVANFEHVGPQVHSSTTPMIMTTLIKVEQPQQQANSIVERAAVTSFLYNALEKELNEQGINILLANDNSPLSEQLTRNVKIKSAMQLYNLMSVGMNQKLHVSKFISCLPEEIIHTLHMMLVRDLEPSIILDYLCMGHRDNLVKMVESIFKSISIIPSADPTIDHYCVCKVIENVFSSAAASSGSTVEGTGVVKASSSTSSRTHHTDTDEGIAGDEVIEGDNSCGDESDDSDDSVASSSSILPSDTNHQTAEPEITQCCIM